MYYLYYRGKRKSILINLAFHQGMFLCGPSLFTSRNAVLIGIHYSSHPKQSLEARIHPVWHP